MSELHARQTAFGQDRDRAESEPDPSRDIELELCALDMEDSDHQDVKSQVCMKVYRTNRTDGSMMDLEMENLLITCCCRLCLAGVFRSGHPTVSGCLPPPPTSLLISPPLVPRGGAPPNRQSFRRKDGCSPVEKDGLQVNYRVNRRGS